MTKMEVENQLHTELVRKYWVKTKSLSENFQWKLRSKAHSDGDCMGIEGFDRQAGKISHCP